MSAIIARPSVSGRKRRVAFLLKIAKKDSELTVRAHRYALRQLALARRANGEISDIEYFAGYHALVKHYVNNLANW
jgi:hypothetical protein